MAEDVLLGEVVVPSAMAPQRLVRVRRELLQRAAVTARDHPVLGAMDLQGGSEPRSTLARSRWQAEATASLQAAQAALRVGVQERPERADCVQGGRWGR